MNKRIIATDFDGTFYIHGQIPENTEKAIARWRNAGNYFGFVTGRGADFFKTLEAKGVTYADFVIVFNGALVCDIKGNIIHEDLMDRETFSMIEKELEKYPDYVYIDRTGDDLFYHQYYAEYVDAERALEIAKIINDKFGDKVTAFVNGQHVNIGAKGSSKSQGVYHILDFYGFDHDAAAVVGDDYNDLQMIKDHKGWAVANGREEVKKEASHICENVGDLAEKLLSGNY